MTLHYLIFISACYPNTTGYFYGTNCEVRCPLNCVSSCHRYSAKCDACPPGYWNLTCNSRCGQCSTNVCNQTTAVCLGDCNPGYYGDTCNTPCPFPGAATCEKFTGASVTCKAGLYGQNCLSNCSRNCLPSSGGQITCNKLSGTCDSQLCFAGYYNSFCTGLCENTCLSVGSNLLGACNVTSAVCLDGCKAGFYGPYCIQTCNQNCIIGTCSRDGLCDVGCKTGYFGDSCSRTCTTTCNDGTCDRITGICAECLKPAVLQTPLCRDAGTVCT